MRIEILNASKRRRENNRLSKADKLDLLLEDIINVPSHTFGNHKECAKLEWPCVKEEKNNEDENYIELLEDTGMFLQLVKIFRT